MTIELRKLGHEAYSCDIIECSGGHPEWHIKDDVLKYINGEQAIFWTGDGVGHITPQRWDMIIAFPPCTHLAVSGAAHFEKKRADGRQREGIEFFCQFLFADCDKVAIENPVGIISGGYIPKWFPDLAKEYDLPRKASQKIQPYEYGNRAKKKTCLWLKGLPNLVPTNIVAPGEFYTSPDGRKYSVGASADMARDENGKIISWNDPRTAKIRSKTYPGIAKAMAEQWAGSAKGYWIESPNCDNVCSECGLGSDTWELLKKCPNCGKEMETGFCYPNLDDYEKATGKKVWE